MITEILLTPKEISALSNYLDNHPENNIIIISSETGIGQAHYIITQDEYWNNLVNHVDRKFLEKMVNITDYDMW